MAVLAVVLSACGSSALAPAAGSTAPAAASTGSAVTGIAFNEVVATQRANYDGDSEVIVGSSNAARDEILRRVNTAKAPTTGVLIGVFQGEQRTGGYAVQVTSIERRSDELLVHAAFAEPAAGGIVTQVITSPAHVVSLASGDLAGAKTAVLLDASGTERARFSIP